MPRARSAPADPDSADPASPGPASARPAGEDPVEDGVHLLRRDLFGAHGVTAVDLGGGLDALDVFRRLDRRGPGAADGAFLFASGAPGAGLVGLGRAVPPRVGTLATLRREHDRLRSHPSALGLVVVLDSALAAETTGVPAPAPDTSVLLRVDTAVEVDAAGRGRLLHPAGLSADEARSRSGRVRELLAAPPDPVRVAADAGPRVRLRETEQQYRRAIDACRSRIAAGDAYQLCLTTQAELAGDWEPTAVWEALQRDNGSARGALLRLGDRYVVSASPEQFLTVTADGTVRTSPMKGTRPRGADEAEDRALAADLLGSEKERAENVMIVDLMRNDLSRVCRPGSVRVSRLLRVERHPQVLQLVSTVEGDLRAGQDAVDAIAACFPAGSMTGAPKRRAVELLQAIEGGPRGLYAGAFGVLAADGSADLTMTIRTLVLEGRTGSVGSGGGITALSDPAEEYAEMRLKLRGVLAAVGARLPDPDEAGD